MNCSPFRAAGHDTTANALSWTWYLLSRYPNVRERFHQELFDALRGTVRRIANPYRVFPIQERSSKKRCGSIPRLRRFSGWRSRIPVWVAVRSKPDELIIISLWNLQRHPEVWAEPDAFLPERFIDGASAERPRLAFMPFGAGHRTCIGNHFAMIEGPLLLAIIAQRYELHLTPDQTVEPEVAVTVKPKNGLKMMVRKRKN